MAEYIEREALNAWCLETMKVQTTVAGMAYMKLFWDKIQTSPSADVAPIKHGKWLLDGSCSECLENPLTTHQNYCPNCGAKMDMEV